MKPERIRLDETTDVDELVDAVLRARFEEVVALAPALIAREPKPLHNFRIACKRLRYALERFCKLRPELEAPAERFAAIADALGEAHDRDALLSILPPTLPETERRLISEREEFVERAAALWRDHGFTP